MTRSRFDLNIWILLGFAAIALAPLTAPGYFSLAHDARHTVYFFQMFDAALRDGALYPRWATDMTFGYGYPVWLILAPLPYYLGELFHLAGLDFVSSAKAVDAVGLLASGLSMYIFASRVLGKDGGLVAAVAYLFIPYHIVDLYVRAAGAEFLAFVFPPLILWALYELVTTERDFYLPLAGLGYAGLVLTHVQMALIFSPVIGGYVLVLWALRWRGAGEVRTPLYPPFARGEERKVTIRTLLLPVAAVLFGLLLSSTYLIPVAFEQKYLTADPLIGGFFDFRQHFISVSQLLSPFWGYGYAGINGGDQFSLQLGIVPIVLAAFSLLYLSQSAGRSIDWHVIFFAIVSILTILLVLPVSAPIWDFAAPVIAFTQFPWRMLSVTALTIAFLAGTVVRIFSSDESFLASLFLSLLLALAIYPNARPQYTEAIFNYNTMMDFEVTSRELLGDTIWMAPGKRPQDSPLVEQYRAGKIAEKAVVVEGEAKVELVEHSSQWDEVKVTAIGPARLLFYTRYFPGWTATIDGAEVAVEPFGEQGLLSVSVPTGVHIVQTHFGDTWPRQAGAVVSLASLIAAIAILWRTRRGLV